MGPHPSGRPPLAASSRMRRLGYGSEHAHRLELPFSSRFLRRLARTPRPRTGSANTPRRRSALHRRRQAGVRDRPRRDQRRRTSTASLAIPGPPEPVSKSTIQMHAGRPGAGRPPHPRPRRQGRPCQGEAPGKDRVDHHLPLQMTEGLGPHKKRGFPIDRSESWARKRSRASRPAKSDQDQSKRMAFA